MNTISTVETATIYELTTAVLGAASLIMGTTLLILCCALEKNVMRSKWGLEFLAVAMFVLSVVNILEFVAGVDSQKERYSLSIVVFTASIELFLIFTAYMSMLCKKFVTRRRMCIEIGSIVLFTTPALFVSPNNHPLLFDVLFVIGVTFYCVKFLWNYIAYRKQMKKTKERVKNLLSDDSNIWLQWINSTFYVVLAIGITSIIAPMTNLTVLIFYNSFLFVAYFYIYLLVVKKISIFDRGMTILENSEVGNIEACSPQLGARPRPTVDFMDFRQKLLDDWIANRGYAVANITAAEVAAHLITNRTKLSFYLNNTLNTTYYDWIARLRIEDAQRQLVAYPDKPIYEIAFSVGIEDRDNFRHLFRKIVGVSPSVYRKQECN